MYIIVDLFCYILLKIIKKLFDFVYNKRYTNAMKLLKPILIVLFNL